MIGLLTKAGSYIVDSLVAAGELEIGAVDTSATDLPPYSCPYGLPATTDGEIVIVVSGWLHEIQGRGIDVVNQVLLPLRQRFDRVIGIDHADPFLLVLTDEMMSVMDVVMKVQGLFVDQDLYNYIAGSPTPDGRWTEKIEPREQFYSPSNLMKLHLAPPCFLGVAPQMRKSIREFYCKSRIRRGTRGVGDRLLSRMTRPLSKDRPPRHTVHFLGSLTHIQRAVALRMLRRSSLDLIGGLTGVPEDVIGVRGVGMTHLTEAERGSLEESLALEGLLVSRLNRFQYQRTMSDCKAVLSIAGYGELCFRMAEAWANRRILVCQDLSHARTLYPFEPGRNVVYCRPDLSDLVDILDDIECNFRDYIDIAEQGYQDWIEWSGGAAAIVRKGFAPLYSESYQSSVTVV